MINIDKAVLGYIDIVTDIVENIIIDIYEDIYRNISIDFSKY